MISERTVLQILSEERNSNKSKRRIKSLILTPARDLAWQISENFRVFGKFTGLKNAVVFAGVSQRAQTLRLRDGVDIPISLSVSVVSCLTTKLFFEISMSIVCLMISTKVFLKFMRFL